MNNFGIYKLFSRLASKNDCESNKNQPNLGGEFLSSLFKNIDLDALKSILLSLPSIAENTPKKQNPPPTKKSSEGINSFIKSHDDFVKKVMQNNKNKG